MNAIARNQKKGNLEGRLFELGKKFIPKELPLNDYPDERDTLCIGVFGEKESFFTLKGLAEKVAETLYLKFDYETGEKTFLHPYQTATIFCQGVEIGYLGKVAYEVAEQLDLRTSAYLLEIDMKTVSERKADKATFVPLSRFPEESRDLALVMNKEITCGQVEDVIRKSCNSIKGIRLFDVYEGEQIPRDKKSMAFNLQFQSKDKTLTDEEADAAFKNILKAVEKHFAAELRA